MLNDIRYLVLEDGTVHEGYKLGADAESFGEIVFNTSMTGVQEIITDNSYTNQIITFSYPLVGSAGFNFEDSESLLPTAGGVVVREASEHPSNFRCDENLDQFLKRHGIPGISGVDTRSITKKIRTGGVMKAMITDSSDHDSTVSKIKDSTDATDQVASVSTRTPYISTGRGPRVALLDFGKKENIVRSLNHRGCDVTVLPHDTPAAQILDMKPHGVMLSNGPGNPEDVQVAIETVKGLIGKVPIFGICLGHQLIALAGGARSYKMKFGHRGANHPVKNLLTGKVEITTQNHGYAIDGNSLENTDFEVTHTALNDGSVEGLRHKSAPVFSVQYHPEAAAGPHETSYLYDQFIGLMTTEGGQTNA
ncbi:carbamoyl-phosphate synthase small subunit [Salinicoccus kekensis]|uniref:Carbamoyl phosphate synthase small chain n=1 Tax=Salinicoccus kekensis TaxID=714307 RepID=A0A285U8F8_9STAP|nr:carbamoyl-phosphate synthase small subunit [Salinicoccus kekensis]